MQTRVKAKETALQEAIGHLKETRKRLKEKQKEVEKEKQEIDELTEKRGQK